MITDKDKQVVSRHDYLPFGEEWNPPASAERRRFVGKERDQETSFDYFGARYFSAGVGRFTTPDPISFQVEMLSDPQRFGRYA